MGKSLLYAAIDAHTPRRFYKLDETAGNAADDGSEGVTLTHTNSPTIGQDGPLTGTKCVLYDQATDVSTGTNTAVGAEETLVIIFNSLVSSGPAAGEYMVTNQVDASNRWSVRVPTNGNIIFAHLDTDTSATARSVEHLTLHRAGDAWQFVTVSWNHTTGIALSYLNGVEAGTVGTTAPNAGGGFNIGSWNSTGTFDYNGKVALVALIPSALDGTAQLALYNAYNDPDPTGSDYLVPGIGMGMGVG